MMDMVKTLTENNDLLSDISSRVDKIMDNVDSLQADNVRMREALKHLVELHKTEMEGISDNMPTMDQWLWAVEQGEKALKGE